ncbi:hypothetical protein JD79_00940 [Geodermatophilus normandii]|uniref:GNAT family N-acetyltransferase n=1 Tax=Geodermatophilus normandii TaxID=1137989 RepID=A0A317QFE9_9ACTN|nr:hypothetical protein [Geodermatophilus normandii]PWW21799.1 hypothetical protein JD79_00940 [Geodermatophilus normandii]
MTDTAANPRTPPVPPRGTPGLLERVGARLPVSFSERRRYHWFWVPATAERRSKPLPEGFELVLAGEQDLPLLRQTGADFPRARAFLAAGHHLWLVRRGDDVAFSAWVFRGSAPTDMTSTGWMPLPDGVVNQEDSVTHPDHRGRGLLASASDGIRDHYVRTGLADTLITVIRDGNDASIRGAGKAGYAPFAVVDTVKTGLIRRTNWRDRAADLPGVVRIRLVFERPPVNGALPPEAEELGTWLEAAVRSPVRGPR